MRALLLETTVLSNFALVQQTPLLARILTPFSPMTTPQVIAELTEASRQGYFPPLSLHWATAASLTETELHRFRGLCERLGQGEASCLAVAISRKLPLATDDRKARRVAMQLGVTVTGTIGLLLFGVKRKTLSIHEADTFLQAMVRHGYFSPVESLQEILTPKRK